MAAALIPLLLALSTVTFGVVMTALFFQFSKRGHRVVPALLIAAGLSLGAILFLIKLKVFGMVAFLTLLAVGFIVAVTPPNDSK